MSKRDTIRAKIFSARKPASRIVSFFGEDIEIRQPLLGDILDAQANEDRQSAIIQMLVDRAYIPGTDEKLFDDSDADNFKTMPFGAEFLRISKAMEELSEVNFLDSGTNSGGARIATQ
jgi:hypothetical protein